MTRLTRNDLRANAVLRNYCAGGFLPPPAVLSDETLLVPDEETSKMLRGAVTTEAVEQRNHLIRGRPVRVKFGLD